MIHNTLNTIGKHISENIGRSASEECMRFVQHLAKSLINALAVSPVAELISFAVLTTAKDRLWEGSILVISLTNMFKFLANCNSSKLQCTRKKGIK